MKSLKYLNFILVFCFIFILGCSSTEYVKITSVLNRFYQKHLLTLVVLAIISIGLLLFYFKPILNIIKIHVQYLYFSIKSTIQIVIKSEIKYFLIIPFLTSVFFAFYLPISYDEAWTYNAFTSKGLITSICYYPLPNNHVLHSVITCFTKYLPFLTPIVCLRSSPIFINLFTWIFTYSFLKKHFNKTYALVIVSIASMLKMNIYYSYMSRGYALLNLFFIIALLFSFNIVKENNQTKHWVWFGISSILGFYTMPSFLYPFVTLNIFILMFNYKKIFKQLVTNLVISVCVIILYLPIIIVSGLSNLTNNRFVAPSPRIEVLKELPTFLLNSISDITGFPWIYIVLFLIISLILLLVKKKKEYILIYLLFIISPFILLIIHSVIPFSRTFSYYGFILVFLIVLPYNDWLQRIKFKYLVFILVLIQSAFLFNFYSKTFNSRNYDIICDNVIKKIEGNKKYLSNDPLFETPLIFNLKTKGYEKAVVKSGIMGEMSADSIMSYDYIIIEKSMDKTIKKVPKFRTEYYNVY